MDGECAGPACGRSFTVAGRRRYCSRACQQAAYRSRAIVTGGPDDGSAHPIVTSPSAPPLGRWEGASLALSALGSDCGPFTMSTDTISGRRWRIRDGVVECEAMVPGGWKEVQRGDGRRRAWFLRWLSAGKEPVLRLGPDQPPDPLQPREAA